MKQERIDSEDQQLSGPFKQSARSIVTVDVERYQDYLDGADMTDAQKEEFLQALWSMVVAFVEMGFGVHPLQEICGQDCKIGAEGAKEEFDAVRSDGAKNAEDNNKLSP